MEVGLKVSVEIESEWSTNAGGGWVGGHSGGFKERGKQVVLCVSVCNNSVCNILNCKYVQIMRVCACIYAHG